ncbi:MAG TPA: PadR family transcriptional regulator [Clostridiales bacterium]|nr:PadR family transcriptional regulator [Clostridiales bacterium]
MDAQLKKGLLEICVLVVLKKNDSYGYQIIKDISSYIELSESTLYPILKRLESSDCLTTYSVEHNSRLRKYYKITELGEKRIKEFLDEWKEVTKIYQFIKGAEQGE